jgi:hypothetical protein
MLIASFWAEMSAFVQNHLVATGRGLFLEGIYAMRYWTLGLRRFVWWKQNKIAALKKRLWSSDIGN